MSALIIQRVKFLFCLILFFYSLTPFSVWSEQEERSILGFKANYVAPSCHITVPAEVDLGSLPPGNSLRSPFNLSVYCPLQRNYFIYAGVIGRPINTWSSYVPMNREDGGPIVMNGQALTPVLSLYTEDGEIVSLEGRPSLSFCKNKTTCVINPNTFVSNTNVAGAFLISIRFTLQYY
ncbi:hypothetical protein IHA49_002675 [Salmonella enterica]|nr:hypothetical protein [Salmonella enterica]EGJ0496216.1 hypothetical protein [Salmonella enterica]EGL9362498.1 hypothetical protein [Salmonella enterica]EGL9530114.1 hypothetical protein [Salmonella enterica]EGL9745798.1 hypothetical protein [Salmonella enterica]